MQPEVWSRLKLFGVAVIAAGGWIALACIVQGLLNVRQFEWQPLFTLLGWRGIAFAGFITIGLGILCSALLLRALSRRRRDRAFSVALKILFAGWTLAVLWLADWIFLEQPLTNRMANKVFAAHDPGRIAAAALHQFTADGSIAALAGSESHADKERLAIMLARISVNRPSVFDNVSIGRTIAKYAERYDVNPILLLHWVYIDSFYGEAPPGPMPFFAEINPEMFRDQVQAHLPAWFVESRIRIALIDGPWVGYIAPRPYSMKLRYALQKATYDIATAPYMNSVYSDLFLILKEYESEFAELLGDAQSSDPLARSFRNLQQHALLKPYDAPYDHPNRDGAYYDRYREDMITFARAAVYRLGSDFDLATKVQALVARYYADQYARRIGPERWFKLSEGQRTALLAMLRDVYVPNIGNVSYNLYMVPEFNCTPINFFVDEMQKDADGLTKTDATWTPGDRERMWGATGLMLRVLGEVWDVMTGDPLPGIVPTDTMPDAMTVLARHQ